MIRFVKIGPYEVLGELGRGGMGVVYRARSSPGEEVAVKLLVKTDPEKLARFERERRLLGTFTAREGFVPLLDAGKTSEGPYLVMPLVPGGTLRDRLARGALGIEETLALGRALAAALGRAHTRGIVHRDVKPENVLYTAEGTPLLADLGLAKHFTAGVPGASQSVSLSLRGKLRGTVGYMSPEQVNDAKMVGPRADVFALGAVLHECLAGRPAFAGESPLELLANLASGTREPLRNARPDAPRWLADVVDRALAHDPADRFADGIELGRALGGQGARPRVRWPRLVTVLAVLAVGGVVAAGVVLANMRKPTLRATPAPPPAPPVPAPPPLPREESGAGLPRGLRLGQRLKNPDGKEIQVYLWRLPGSAGDMELVQVPAGDFVMGADDQDAYDAEKLKHAHRMEHAYWIGRNDVTWSQYLAFCKATERKEPEKPDWWERVAGTKDDHPVVMVSWDDAEAYSEWAGLLLPSEAEWERAARGTEGRKYPWGNDWDPGRRCNFADKSCPLDTFDMGGKKASEVFKELGWEWDQEHDDGYAFTSPVGSYPEGVSPVGALDMAGNVWQWCEDWYDEKGYDRYAKGDYSPRSGGSYRVSRGGGWCYPARYCRSSRRSGVAPSARGADLGFRVFLRSSS